MSPKYSSLAFDEVNEQITEIEEGFEPELSLLVNMRKCSLRNSSSSTFTNESDEIVKVRGRVTVSF